MSNFSLCKSGKPLREIRGEVNKAFNDNADVFVDYSDWMNEVSGDIKNIELALHKRGVKQGVDLIKNIDGAEYRVSWKYYKHPKANKKTKGCFRLVAIFNGEERPLLEQPFHVRDALYPHMGELIRHISHVLRTKTLGGDQ